MNISDTLAPNSDQLDAVDLLGGPQIFTITEVIAGNAEQPVQIRLAEFPRVWRPGKSMRRVLAALWGEETDDWIGKCVKLYCDVRVKFGNDVVGGTRIAEMSDIGDKPRGVPLLVSKGRSATFTVKPLVETAAPPKKADTPKPTLDPETERATADLRTQYEASTDETERADLLAQRDRLLAGGAK